MSKIKSVYVAGKMEDDEWRRDLFGTSAGYDSSHPQKSHPIKLDEACYADNIIIWPECSNTTVCGLDYTGPFFVDNLSGHGFQFWPDDEHGANINGDLYAFSITNHGAELRNKREETQRQCFYAIERADLLFAWIDCTDCYGTIAEIGYAKALGKTIWIAGTREYRDLWFVYQMADEVRFANHGPNCLPQTIFRCLLNDYQILHREFDSPIEKTFWLAWHECNLDYRFELTPQHPIGKYRVDFAHIKSLTAIELDGHATHSSPDAIAKDRKRQREIEEQGWHVIRFGGKEIYSDVSAVAYEACRLLEARCKDKS